MPVPFLVAELHKRSCSWVFLEWLSTIYDLKVAGEAFMVLGTSDFYYEHSTCTPAKGTESLLEKRSVRQ
ncbi:hypothetical protein PAEVO_47810 [Paenibacillus sp. GM2FR]|nr:hypothetical protein PAEVO_47810 [Paenibacillus sp. GM2FR]